jgi:transcriptional regulator GlxA family with amidase domain
MPAKNSWNGTHPLPRLVRRALLRANSWTTVTRIATAHGFWELGRFSINYHAMFGETRRRHCIDYRMDGS